MKQTRASGLAVALVIATAGATVAEDATLSGGEPMPIELLSTQVTTLDERVVGLGAITERPWEALVVHPDGRTVDVYFLAGDPDCTELHDLKATVRPSDLEVVVLTGNPSDAEFCDQGLRTYVVTVELDDPAFGGGSIAVPLADESPVAAALAPGPTPKPTPFLHEGSVVAWREAPDLMQPISREPEWAGWYLDVDRDRTPVVMWAGDLDEAGTLIAEALGEDATFEVRPAERTWKELRDIANQVSAMRPAFDERGILLVETGRNAKRNRVDVGIKARQKKLAVAERMLAEFGDSVRVRRVNVPQIDD